MKEEGTVIRWEQAKGFGFIQRDHGGEVFAHHSAIIDQQGFRALAVGDRVRFDVAEGMKGPAAESIERIG